MNSENTIEVKGSLNLHEYCIKKELFIGVYILMTFIDLIIVIFFYWIKLAKSGQNIKFLLDICLLVLSPALVGLLILDKPYMYKRKKEFENSDRKKEHIYTINDEGINRQIEKKSLFIKWSDITKVTEFDNLYKVSIAYKVYDYYHFNKAIIIPKRFFDNESNRLDFLKKIRKNLTARQLRLVK